MPTRSYFRKARLPRPPKPVKPPKPPKPAPLSMGTATNALGKTVQVVNTHKALAAMGARKHALKLWAEGRAYKWDSEAARKAAKKSWKRRRFNRAIGARVGMKANRRKPLWRPPLREYYADNPTNN